MLLDVADTYRLCICLELDSVQCKIIHEKSHGTWRNLITDIANAWYRASDWREWKEVVSALRCMGKLHEAHDLARRKEVD